ncbi:ABC transporter permease subunit [Acetonema longum]|uniref:ABC transporter permease subunit n=1 Tax=Acetonema longum TaxID=2374 RepID=UPI0002DE6145|nr:ABC transporter permease subunit [Acetonema longum]
MKLLRWTTIGYACLIYFFLYIPIFVLMAFSFNDSKLNVVWMGFTLKWYAALFEDAAIMNAFKLSMTLALVSTLASTMIGALTAVGMYKYHFRGKSILDGLLYIPILIPEVVMGVSLLALFSLLQIPVGFMTLLISHVAFSIPFVVIVVRARLDGFDPSLEEAAMDLGANHWQTLTKIVLPIIMPGILSGALLAFTLSLDDVIISFFVSGPATMTLPLKIFSMVKFGVTPTVNALSTLLLLLTLLMVLVAEYLNQRKTT